MSSRCGSNLGIQFLDRAPHALPFREYLSIAVRRGKIETENLAVKIFGKHQFNCFAQFPLLSPDRHQVDAGKQLSYNNR